MARQRDPQTNKLMIEGIRAVVSARTGAITYRARYAYGAGDRRRYVGKTFKHYGEAEAWLLAQRLDIRHGRHIDASAMTVADYHAQWSRRMATQWSGARQRTVRLSWEKYIAPFFGDMRIQQVTRASLQQLIDHLTASGLGASTVRLHMVGIVSMLKAAEHDGVIDRTPATGLRYPRETKTPKAVWSALQLRTFLAKRKAADDPWYPLWAFLAATGCRIGEALAVQWIDIDLEAGTVWIHRTRSEGADGVAYLKVGTKTSASGRTVPLEPWIVEVLRSHAASIQGPLVFQRDGEMMPAGTIRGYWSRAVTATGLPKITLHGVRHSVATAMIAAGVSERIVQEVLGHRSIVTTMDIYAHVSTQTQRQGTGAMATLLGMGDEYDNIEAKQAEK